MFAKDVKQRLQNIDNIVKYPSDQNPGNKSDNKICFQGEYLGGYIFKKDN